jgi:hypothetical protein
VIATRAAFSKLREEMRCGAIATGRRVTSEAATQVK